MMLIKSVKSITLIWALFFSLFMSSAQSEVGQKVLQVNASLSIANQAEFDGVPFILLEGETSTLAEEGLGGFKVELVAIENSDQSYTLNSKIYNYIKSGFNILATGSIKLAYKTSGTLELTNEEFGPVVLHLKVVEQAEMATDGKAFEEIVR